MRGKKVAIMMLVLIVVGSAYLAGVEARKPAGSPCYVLDTAQELGAYNGSLHIAMKNGYILIYSGTRVYYSSNLYRFESTEGNYSYEGDEYVKYEGNKVYVGGMLNKVFNEEDVAYDYPYVAVIGSGKVWVYNISSGDYYVLNITASRVGIAGGVLYVESGGAVYRYALRGGVYEGVFLRDVDDFAVLKDRAGYLHYAYVRDGTVWYRDTVPNIYELLNESEYLNVSAKETLKEYFDGDAYDMALEYLSDINVSGVYALEKHYLESRINYTKEDPRLPDTSVHTVKDTLIYTFPAYKITGDLNLKLGVKGLGTTIYIIKDPINGEKVVHGSVHLYIYLNGVKVADLSNNGVNAALSDWKDYTVTLKSDYIKHDKELNELKLEFKVVYDGGSAAYDKGEVKYEALRYAKGDVFADADSDGLGLAWEYYYGTNPNKYDTDGDGLSDGTEVNGWSITVNGVKVKVHSSPTVKDSDGDGLNDKEERETPARIRSVGTRTAMACRINGSWNMN